MRKSQCRLFSVYINIMCKRLIILDAKEFPTYVVDLVGKGLQNVVTVQQLTDENADPKMVKELITLGQGDAALLCGAGGFKYLQQFYHFGIRGENYADCSKLRRLSIEGGAYVKCTYELPTLEEITDFMDPDFTKDVDFSWFQHKILHTFKEVMTFLDYMDSLPQEQDYGFDYEASGMPLDKWFEISGASLCTEKFGGFISFTDLRHTGTKQEYDLVLKRLGDFLTRRMEHIWTYNMQYEFQVSHRMLGVDLYNLCDASVVNVLDGDHLKKFSLKWTAQRVLQAKVWDTEFDRISDLIDGMLFEEVGKLKKDKHKVLRVTEANYDQTPQWKELMTRYSGYEKEFRALIHEYWGNAFMCIPSEILGHYCNLDAFYTLMIYKKREKEYSKDAWRTFLGNTRLGCRLHSSGFYIDENFRLKYKEESLKMMAWGITYCATARCKIKMQKHQVKMANIKKYNPIAVKLLKDNKFFNGDQIEIAKYLLSENLDTMDVTDTGLDEGQILLDYGKTFAEAFIQIVKESMAEVKMKGKIDSGIVRKKKILGVIGDKLIPLLGLDKLKIDNKHIELEKYLYYERAYLELTKISKNQLKDIQNIPQEIYAFGKKMNILEYSDYISENYFKCKSPIENDEICKEFAELFKSESAWLAALLDSTQQLKETTKFYSSRGIDKIEDGYLDFMKQWEDYYNTGNLRDYPEKVFDLAMDYFKNPTSDRMKDIWSNFDGYNAQSQFFGYVDNQFLDYGKPFTDTDLYEKFFFMRKLVLSYLLYKKYAKVLSTYIDGMFKANNKLVIEGEDHIPLRYADPGEPGAVEKCFVHYEVNTKSSKRWSSAIHTAISHSDLKDCIVAPPAWDDNGNIIYGGSDQILTYFDINKTSVT